MDFSQAWDALAIGDAVSVSDGSPAPSANVEGFPYKCWKSHNFSGTVAEKIDGPPRAMRIDQEPDEAGSVVGYVLAEGVGHSFSA
jgi:hypothetical protein